MDKYRNTKIQIKHAQKLCEKQSCVDHPKFCYWNSIHDQAGRQRGAEINGWWLKQESAESGALPKMIICSTATTVHALCTPFQCLSLWPKMSSTINHSMRMVIQTLMYWSLDPVYKQRLWLIGAFKSSKYLVQVVLHQQAASLPFKRAPAWCHQRESGCDDQTL